MNRLDIISSEYGKRSSRTQRMAFVEYAMSEFEKMGYETAINRGYTLGVQSDNLIAGSVYRAGVVFAVYYDTPKTNFFPHIKFPLNKMLGKIFFVIPYIILLVAMHFLCAVSNFPLLSEFLMDACIIIALALLIDNKNNMSSNASVAAAFELAEKAGGEAAFVFIDNGCRMKLGRGVFINTYGDALKGKTIIIIDGAAYGEATAVLYWGNTAAPEAESVCSKRIEKNRAPVALFENGVLLASCQKSKNICYISRYACERDAEFDENSYMRIVEIAENFIPHRRSPDIYSNDRF